MYLLSKTRTVLIGATLSGITVWLVFGMFNDIAKNSIPSVVFSIILLVLYAQMWIDYVKAFKRRVYDRAYAKEKVKLFNTLMFVLPQNGSIEFKSGDIEIEVLRKKTKLFSDSFIISVPEKGEAAYDEDTSTHTVLLSQHTYRIYRRSLRVHKDFDLKVVRVKKELDSSDITITADTPAIGVSNRKAARAILKTPEELRIASVEEMRDLNTLLVDSERGIVS